jgi:hypothetical protein
MDPMPQAKPWRERTYLQPWLCQTDKRRVKPAKDDAMASIAGAALHEDSLYCKRPPRR